MSGFFLLVRQSAKLRYLLQSGMIFAINFTVNVALHEWFGIPADLAFAVAIVTVVITGFLSLKYFVYQAPEGKIGRELLAYLPSVGMFAALQYVIYLAIHDWVNLDYRIANVAAQSTTFISKFFFYRAFVFRRGAQHVLRSVPETNQKGSV